MVDCEVWPRAVHLDRRAGKIGDPIKRLRFLRKALRRGSEPRVVLVIGAARPARRPAAVAVATVLTLACAGAVSDAVRRPDPGGLSAVKPAQEVPEVWLVEKNAEWELYSNGLRLEIPLAVSTRPRLYTALPRTSYAEGRRRWQTVPAGIVFHASEGTLASFEPEHNGLLKRQSLGLLAYAHRHRLYHFVVDRFGRVHRIVRESDVADHAGHSVWVDSGAIYLGLNRSFLGVAFEARTGPGAETALLSSAQIHAGRVLTELLRHKYRIAPENCITHAQVSVNPRNFRGGFHADWACHFPFRQLGLPDNYRQPPPSVYLFGFTYDETFLRAAEPSLRASLSRADEDIRQQAAAQPMKPARWREVLHRRYREATAEAKTERAAVGILAVEEVLQP